MCDKSALSGIRNYNSMIDDTNTDEMYWVFSS